ncbi:hypothetical protein ANCDUO_16502 [Ancylostoma duodenale]|uniref:Uncharacterized protein n=1 Tax=Ancylostoma duodenale TaxID=51022 RepID=A0A0C2CAR3_9BILA|nr:hypothetical protein ANCDUO_16502 [Ancylostoma duodenale]
MLYASSVRALKSTLGLESLMQNPCPSTTSCSLDSIDPVAFQVQASDLSDLDERAIKHDLVSSQRT